MASDVQSLLSQLQLNNYTSLVIVVAISYDYCLTFSREVTYIWQRPWTKVSTLFLLIRYMGCLFALGFAFSTIFYLLGVWAYIFFLAAADMVMILRVYAMYNRSKIILGVLFTMYVIETVILVITSSIYSDPTYATVSMVQLLDVTVCTVNFSIQSWDNAATITQFILGAILCILAVAQFVRDSLEMYRVTRRWQLNRYMNLLVKDGLLYFLVTVLHSLLTMLGILNALPQGWVSQVLAIIANVPLITLTPRFVMNVRELYLYDMQSRWDHDIDSGFGLSSGAGRNVGGLVTNGMIEFVEGGRTEMSEDGEEMAALERRVENGGKHLVVV